MWHLDIKSHNVRKFTILVLIATAILIIVMFYNHSWLSWQSFKFIMFSTFIATSTDNNNDVIMQYQLRYYRNSYTTSSLHLRGGGWDYSTVIWSHSISCPSITYDQTIYKREQVDIDNSRSMLLVVGYVIWECSKSKAGWKERLKVIVVGLVTFSALIASCYLRRWIRT